MFPWFNWNGEDSREKGIFVKQLPPITRAKRRVKRVKIPGRPGDVTVTEGEEIYEAYVRECVIQVDADRDYTDLLAWLRGAGTVIFSNEPERVYTASIDDEVVFERASNSLHQAVIPFYCQPLKAQYPPEADVEITEDSTITNPGDVYSKPIVTITGTGAASVEIGAYKIEFNDLPGVIEIDCDTEIITVIEDGGTDWDWVWEGDYFRIMPGTNEVKVEGCEITIKPRWKWV